MQIKILMACFNVLTSILSLADIFIREGDKEAKIRTINRCIARMPPQRREYLRMRKEEGLPYYEIAKRKGVDKELVLKELSRAYGDIRMATYDDDEGDPVRVLKFSTQ